MSSILPKNEQKFWPHFCPSISRGSNQKKKHFNTLNSTYVIIIFLFKHLFRCYWQMLAKLLLWSRQVESGETGGEYATPPLDFGPALTACPHPQIFRPCNIPVEYRINEQYEIITQERIFSKNK